MDLQKLFSATILSTIVMSSTAMAGQVTSGNVATFTAGTPALASEVNGNFAEHTTQINDNDTRITTNTTAIGTKQNRVNGTCVAGQSIRAINADGTVTCEVDSVGTGDITDVTAGSGITGGGTSGAVTLSLSGAVSVYGVGFHLSGLPANSRDSSYGVTQSSGSTVLAYANLALPDGVTLTSLTCRVVNNTAITTMDARVRRMDLTGTGVSVVTLFDTPAAIASSTVRQTLTDTTISSTYALVDNSTYAYNILVYIPSGAYLHGCTVSYS